MKRNQLLRPRQIADLCSLPETIIRQEVSAGRLPGFRLGGERGHVRVYARDVERWLSAAYHGRKVRLDVDAGELVFEEEPVTGA